MKKFIVTYHFGQNKFTQIENHQNRKKAMYRAWGRMGMPYFDMEYGDGGLQRIITAHVTNITVNEVK